MKKSFLAIFMLMVIACSSKEDRPDLMSEAAMAEFLLDLHMSEAGVQDLRLQKDTAKIVFSAEEKFLFKKHNVTDSLFISSYAYYLDHPEKLELIYSAVIDSLSLKQVLHRESAGE